MKRYDSYKDSGIEWMGVIPSNWKLIKNRYGFQKHKNGKNESDDTSVLSLTIKGVKVKTNLNFGKSTESYIGHQLVEEGDIVFTPRDFDQTPILSDVSKYNGCISNLYIVDKTKEDVLNHYVNYYWYGLKYSVDYFKNFSHGMRYSFNRFQFDEIPLLKPTLSEQQQIVSFLDTKTSLIDSLIEKTQLKIELLKEKRTSLINEVVTKGLNPNVEMKDSSVEWIGEIPIHWFCVGTNKVYSDLGTGTTPTSDNTEYYSDNGCHWITTTDLNEGIMYDTLSKITEKSVEDYPNLRLYPSGSIYISMYGGRIGKLGVSTFDSYCNQSVCVLPKNDEIIVKFYYYWFLGFQEFVKGMGRGGGQPNINKDMIKSFPTVKIPLTEQQQIVEYLDEQTGLIHKTISIEKKRIKLLKEYRQSLISEVVTGKRKVV